MKRVIPHLFLSTLLLLGASTALAEPAGDDKPRESLTAERQGPSYGFFEASGAFGFQFGEQPYIPNGTPGNTKHPLTNGFGASLTAGYEFLDGLAVVADYTYVQGTSRSGDLDNVLVDVEGKVDYHALTAGLRSSRWLGAGRLYGELAAGVVLPFSTEIEYDYAPAMGQIGVTGQGRKIDNYALGFGVHGELGYQLRIWDKLYVASALRIQGFQSNNDGETTELDNFVADFSNPQPLTMDISHGTVGEATPETYSVQDVRLHLNIGYWF